MTGVQTCALPILNLEAVGLRHPADPVGHQVGPQVAYMGVPVHRWTAGVHADEAGLDGLDLFDLFGQGIEDA